MKIERALLLALCLGLALFLFLQPGGINDECEHLHAAWLMAARGLRPIDGFFEHHVPLFWDVLALGFRAGIAGPESLYWGRLLVIACAGVWGAALFSLPRTSRGVLALSAFAAVAVFAQDLVVVRPETLSIGLFGASLLLWDRKSLFTAVLAGVLFGGTVLASPRFVLLAPAFLLVFDALPPVRQIAALVAGGIVAAAAALAWIVPWRDLLFDVRFSAVLQGVGLPAQVDMRYLGACLFSAVLLGAIAAEKAVIPRKWLTAWAAFGALVWGASFLAAGLHAYAQAFAPALIWNTLFIAWLEGRPRAEAASRLRTIGLAGAAVTTLTLLGFSSGSMFSAAALTASRRMLLDSMPPGSTVLLRYPYHPISADDASYWGTILMVDSPGRLCAAVDEYEKRYPGKMSLPRCSLLRDLRARRPWAVSRDLAVVGPVDEYFGTQREIETQYESNDLLAAAPTLTFSSYILFRKKP